MGSGVSSFGKRESPLVAVVESGVTTSVSNGQEQIYSGSRGSEDEMVIAQVRYEIDHRDGELNFCPNEMDECTDRYLSNCFSQETPHQNSIEPPYSSRSAYSDGGTAAAEMFSHTAMSLGMDNDDLLFNLMYFNEGQNSTFGAMMDGVQSETLALHSENNTPYKLKPASTSAISGLTRMQFGVDLGQTQEERVHLECECAVCKDDIGEDMAVLQIPSCQHFFHEECLLRWINLQGWCPVCRAPVEAAAVLASAGLLQEDILGEEGPSTDSDHPNEEAPAQYVQYGSVKLKAPSMRLFGNEDDPVPVRIGDMSTESLSSQKLGSDLSKLPGSKQCV